MRSKLASASPCSQIFASPVTCVRAVASASNNSAATMMCLGSTTLMQCASAAPVRLVLRSATTPPTRVTPTHSAMNSGRPGIIRQIVSPFLTSCVNAQRA